MICQSRTRSYLAGYDAKMKEVKWVTVSKMMRGEGELFLHPFTVLERHRLQPTRRTLSLKMSYNSLREKLKDHLMVLNNE